MLITELLHPNEIEKLLRDSYANYVVQTAMDFADPATATRLVDSIRPLLPTIRTTPYGRRIANKIADRDNRASGGRGSISGNPMNPLASEPGNVAESVMMANSHMQGMMPQPYRHPLGTMSPTSSVGLASSPPNGTPPHARYIPNGHIPNGQMLNGGMNGNMF